MLERLNWQSLSLPNKRARARLFGRRWERAKVRLIGGQSRARPLARGCVDAHVGDLRQPAQHFPVGGIEIPLQPAGSQRCGQWHEKASLQVAVKTLNLALGARSVRSTHTQLKAGIAGKLQHPGVPTMLTWP